jgi:uncharacterized membrane protein YbhN (UPF0104 family)
MRRLFIDLAKLALSGGLIWLSFSKIDSAHAFALLKTLHPGVVAAAIALLLLQHVFGGMRFHQLLVQLRTPVSKFAALGNIFVGFFFSQVFISFIGGDAIRVWRLVDAKVPVASAFKSVLFDRVLGFVSLIILIMLCIPALFHIVTDPAMRTSLLLTVLVGILGTLVFLFMHRLPQNWQRWRVFQIASDISSMALSISGRYAAISYLLFLSLLIQVSNVVAIYVIALGLGIQANFIDLLVLIPPVMLLAILPISYAGWGVREGSMALALGMVGVHAEQSVAISICFGLCMIASGLPGAILWLRTRKKQVDQGIAA